MSLNKEINQTNKFVQFPIFLSNTNNFQTDLLDPEI